MSYIVSTLLLIATLVIAPELRAERINNRAIVNGQPLRAFQGRVNRSFWISANRYGVPVNLRHKFAKIFAWNVDFKRGTALGDRWRFIVRERVRHGKHYGWGPIIVAEYIHRGKSYQGVYYHVRGQRPMYYYPNGRTLKTSFLDHPVKDVQITSKFSSQRLHPILKVLRPHFGVDYAATAGARVMSVSDGWVTAIGYSHISGHYIRLRHDRFRETSYCHLKRIAKGLRLHKWVQQKQVIGYVGNSGLATAPHLHYSLKERGRYVNPLSRRFSNHQSYIPNKYISAFKNNARFYLAKLPEWHNRARRPLSIKKIAR